ISDAEARLRGWMEYRVDLFEERTIARLAAQYGTLLKAGLKEVDRPLMDLPLIPASERAELLAVGRGPATPIPPVTRGLCEVVESRVRVHPDRLAVEFGHEALTYGELNTRANQLAHRLRSRGLGVEGRIGIFLERDPSMVVAVLAVLKCGAAYVPLDLEHPPGRVAAMVTDARVELVITARSFADQLPPTVPTISMDAEPDL